jgi:pimeloyl-ACP methyl ester carboxylesterase
MINYIDVGKGTPIIFIHGLGQTHNAWQPQMELLDTYRLITVDLRGHGDSEHTNTDITLENMALDVIELIEHLDLKSVYLCGLSLGGIVTQEVYRQREDLVKGLIIANSTFYIPSILGNKVIEKSKKVLEHGKDELIERIVRKDIFHKEFAEEAKQSFYIGNSYLECSKVALGYNYFPVLLRCKVPVLLIGGLHDSTTPLFNTYMMKWAITNSKMVILNAGHISNFDCREEFNKAILEFIN